MLHKGQISFTCLGFKNFTSTPIVFATPMAIREYPEKSAAHLLGYVSQVPDYILKKKD